MSKPWRAFNRQAARRASHASSWRRVTAWVMDCTVVLLLFLPVFSSQAVSASGHILTFHLACEAGLGSVPHGSVEIAYLSKSEKPLCVLNHFYLTSKDLESAHIIMEENDRLAVSIVFNKVGARRFSALTRENVGRRIVMVLDGKILSAPTVREEISSGRVQITGMGSFDETRKLVERIQQAIKQSSD